MLDSKIKIWSFINSALLMLTTIVFISMPEKIFVINQNLTALELSILASFFSSMMLLIFVFIASYIKIKKVRACQGFAVFRLLGSGLALLLLMLVKTMSDQIAHELQILTTSISGIGEYYILLIALVIIISIQMLFSFSRKL